MTLYDTVQVAILQDTVNIQWPYKYKGTQSTPVHLKSYFVGDGVCYFLMYFHKYSAMTFICGSVVIRMSCPA